MRMTVALFSNIEYGFESIRSYEDNDGMALERSDKYVRLSEPVDVEFKILPKNNINEKKAKIIDREINKLKGQICRLEKDKQELLSLEHKD